MKKFIPSLCSIALFAASLPVHALNNADRYGEESIPAVASRIVMVSPGTRWVNVAHDEVVRFVSSDQEFSWHFDGMLPKVSLREIAPASFRSARDVIVYVGAPVYPVGD